jgi:uncharacterized protein (DUF302 family)
MDEKYKASELVRVIPVERVTLVSTRGFDDVVAAIYSGLGRPDDFAALVQRWATADDAEAFDAAVAEAAGSAGLIEFLSLDLGEALAKHPGFQHYRLLRIIAGNPVTMASMTSTVADAGSYAPVTILVAERSDGVHIAYDRVASAIAPYQSSAASTVAVDLDREVLELLRTAAGAHTA